jgi:hypothetical protein
VCLVFGFWCLVFGVWSEMIQNPAFIPLSIDF